MASYYQRVLLACCILIGVAAAQAPSEVQACLDMARGESESTSATAEVLTGAVSMALSTVVLCEEDQLTTSSDVAGLSIAVAISISESRVAAEQCATTPEEQADATGRLVTDAISNTLRNQLDGDSERLADAWLQARGPSLLETVRMAEQQASRQALDSEGCLDFSSLTRGLPTAEDVGNVLGDAIGQILRAVTCGDNVVQTDEVCWWRENEKRFYGGCLSM
ncbi:hypothetical protein BSKO_03634 [Bryopsis sp. KO-2023]|nr:hypothetical protein BSKO_03634 [Bryopsis sp. KO-2023]